MAARGRTRAVRAGLVGRGAASAPSRVLLGTSVLTPTFRYNPAVVAQAFATLGCLEPGRVILGVGSGEALNEVRRHGLRSGRTFKERFARLREAVRLMRRCGPTTG